MDYKKMSYISGVIIFFSFLILMMSIIWLAEKRIFFTRDYIVYVKFDDVVGLRDHSQVFMRGYRIGWTKGVKFLKDGVLVRVDVNKKYDVPTDSRWEINTLNFMGEKAITVQPGKKDLFLQPGAEVPGYNRDLISVTKMILTGIQKKIDEGDLESKIRTLGDSLVRFHSILEKGDKKIDQIDIAAYNQEIKKIGGLAGELKGLSSDFRTELASTGKQGRESLVKMDKAMEQMASLSAKLDSIASKIDAGEGSAGALVNDKKYIESINTTLQELQDLIKDFRKNPKKYVKLSIF